MAALTGVLFYRQYKATAAKYFIWFLVYVAILELIGFYPTYFVKFGYSHIIRNTVFEHNYWYYTVFWYIGSAIFFTFYYHRIIVYKPYRSILKYGGALFLLSTIGYIFTHGEAFFNSQLAFVRIFGAIIVLIGVVFYFIEMLQSDRVLTFYRSLNFYISAIVLIWWLIITPLVFYNIYFSKADWNFVILKWQIYLFANIFMYSSFTFALIWCRPQNNS